MKLRMIYVFVLAMIAFDFILVPHSDRISTMGLDICSIAFGILLSRFAGTTIANWLWVVIALLLMPLALACISHSLSPDSSSSCVGVYLISIILGVSRRCSKCVAKTQ